MDASDESSRADESQPSQLLRAILPQRTSTPTRPSYHNDKERTQGGISEVMSNSGIVSPHILYNLHGLAATQISEIEHQPDGEGSQKENAHASWDMARRDRSSPAPPVSALVPSKNTTRHKDTLGDEIVTSHVSMKRPATPVNKPSKGVSFVSPLTSPQTIPHRVTRASTVPLRAMHEGQKERSPSPMSEDSFAGPLSYQDPERLFLESTKKFNVPLSELGRSMSSVATSSASTTNMHHFSPKTRRVAPPTPAQPLAGVGEVLVAATPSNSSSSSNSQSASTQAPLHLPLDVQQQQSSDSQLSDLYPQAQAQRVDYEDDEDNASADLGNGEPSTFPTSLPDDASTEPSSSYERLLNMDFFEPNPVATQIATQLSETEATQPNGPTQEATTSAVAETAISGYIDRQYPAESTSVPSESSTRRTVPRGMLSMIPPHKRWRYQESEAASAGASDPPGVPSVALAPPTLDVQDTQPSDALAVDGSPLTHPQMTPLSSRPRRQRTMRANGVEHSEIVPDSEPMPVDDTIVAGSSNIPPQSVRTPTRPSMQRGRATHSTSEDVIPDSAMAQGCDVAVTDGEEDVPLFIAIKSTAHGKGKEKEKPYSMTNRKTPAEPTSHVSGTTKEGPQTTAKSKAVKLTERRSLLKSGKRHVARSPSAETSVIPSSEPIQDALSAAVVDSSHRGSARGRKNEVVHTVHSPQTRPAARTTPSTLPKKSRHRSAEESSDDETAVSKDVTVSIPDVEGEVETELADDDCLNVDDEEVLPPRATATRKRKRSVSRASKKVTSRASTRTGRSLLTTPLVRREKRSKTSSVAHASDGSATRVYALWKQDGHYYPGTVYSIVSTSPMQYVVHFDDGTESNVDISKLRLCQLHVGDNVLLLPDNHKAKVVDNSCLERDRTVTVEIDNGEETEEIQVDVKNIRIASRTLISAWKDRMLTPDMIDPVIKPKVLKNSPSPSKLPVGSVSSIRGARRPLTKTGLVVTLSPANDRDKEKDRLLAAIKNSGGTVIDDWLDIFTMEGAYSQNNKRWVIQKQDVHWCGRPDVERVFLLSDDMSHKPKFLIALALGIPCVSIEWLLQTTETKTEKDWSQFLLPAGFCDPLNARVSQMVDLDWGNSTEHLSDIMSNLVASKLFADQSILCVAPEFVPLPAKTLRRNNDSDKDRSTRMVPRIILCMGASRVEAVPDIRYASDLPAYDYVVVKEYADVNRIPETFNCVHFGWVKDCLVAGRLLDRPEY